MFASGSWLTLDRIRRVAVICGAASLGLLLWLGLTSHGTLDWLGRPLGTDFSDVWAAGKMALDGHAAEAWIWSKHFAVQRAVHGPKLTELYAWHYPPPFLLVASPLALLPYLAALIAWELVTLILFAGVMQRLLPGRDTLLLTLAAPVTVFCLTQGQNGFLTASLMGAGLMLLDRRPVIAGLLFGCLVYKPQFGVIIPVMLLAGRNWRAVASAFLSAGMLIALTIALWGWPVWQAFIDSLTVTRSLIIEHGAAGFYKIVSPFAAVRLWGGAIAAGYAVQAASTFAAVAATFAMSLPSRNPALRNAVVCATAVVATPYVLDYDLVLLLPALAWLYVDGRRNGFMTWDATLMAGVWIAPLFGRSAAQLIYVPLDVMAAAATLALALRRALGRDSMTVGHVHSRREEQVRQPKRQADQHLLHVARKESLERRGNLRR